MTVSPLFGVASTATRWQASQCAGKRTRILRSGYKAKGPARGRPFAFDVPVEQGSGARSVARCDRSGIAEAVVDAELHDMDLSVQVKVVP
jgi:hypothetical protein